MYTMFPLTFRCLKEIESKFSLPCLHNLVLFASLRTHNNKFQSMYVHDTSKNAQKSGGVFLFQNRLFGSQEYWLKNQQQRTNCALKLVISNRFFWRSAHKLLPFLAQKAARIAVRMPSVTYSQQTTYSWSIKCQKCAGMGLNGFISKKIN